MRDYALLAKSFRHCAEKRECASCPMYVTERKCPDFEVRKLAADAIEELLKENGELENSGRVLMAAFARLKEKVPHWISVEERLPEAYQNVLTCAWKLFGPDRRRVYGIDYTLDNGEWACGGESYKTIVTHWMPLPSTEGLK